MRMRRIKLTLRINDDHMLCLCLNKNRLIPFSPSIFARQSGAGRPRLCQAQEDNLSLSKNPGVVKGRLPIKLYSGSDGMHVRTDENPEVFVPCGFCRPGANARGKTRENSKKRRSATFSTLSSSLSLRGCFYACINHILFSCSSLASSFFSISSAAASFLRSSAITFSGAFATKP